MSFTLSAPTIQARWPCTTIHATCRTCAGRNSGEPADLAAVEILRDRERGVPRYCEFRRLLDMKVPESFLELTGGRADLAREIEAVYGGDLAKVDTMIGMLAEPYPEGFAFSDTAFRIFILMASRRLKSDRFFTDDYTPEVYTPVGARLDCRQHNEDGDIAASAAACPAAAER